LAQKSIKAGETLNLKVDIKNTGERDGQEIVQVYVRDVAASVPRPLKELKGFQKVPLKAGATKTVHFTLSDRDFAFWDSELEAWKIEPGLFEILVGRASNNILVKGLLEVE